VTTRALNEVEAKALLAAAGVAVTRTELARSGAEAAALAERLGFPVALKIVSPDIVHKSDVDGVRLGLPTVDAVRAAFGDIVNAVRARQPDARADGVSVQPMAPPGGIEVIVGVSVDPQFGHVIMCGLGGVLVEVLEDVAFRLVPLQPRDARQMLSELRGLPLLRGARGRPGADLHAVETLLLRVSALVERRPDIRELDLNPVLAYPDGVVAVDARALIEVSA
jgi:acyl-CoA synthetase (NDP forming)